MKVMRCQRGVAGQNEVGVDDDDDDDDDDNDCEGKLLKDR